MTEPLEYWSLISREGEVEQEQIFRRDLYQCIMMTGMFEQIGFKVTIGMYDKILYQTGSLNSKIFVRTLNSEMTDAHVRIIPNVFEAWENFRCLTNRYQHKGGYWELLDSNHFFQAYESIINVVFIWRPLQLNIEEEVDWVKEGF